MSYIISCGIFEIVTNLVIVTIVYNIDDRTKFLRDIDKQFVKLTNRVVRLTMEVIIAPIVKHMAVVPKLAVWSSTTIGDALSTQLPTFSLTPQEYITKVM